MPYQYEDTAELSTQGLQHPNPLFDFLTTFVPRRLKTLFQYCEYLYYNSPQIFAALNKFAIYPVTKFVYETDNDVLKKNYETLFEDILNLKSMLIRTGIDRHVYGTASPASSFRSIGSCAAACATPFTTSNTFATSSRSRGCSSA